MGWYPFLCLVWWGSHYFGFTFCILVASNQWVGSQFSSSECINSTLLAVKWRITQEHTKLFIQTPRLIWVIFIACTHCRTWLRSSLFFISSAVKVRMAMASCRMKAPAVPSRWKSPRPTLPLPPVNQTIWKTHLQLITGGNMAQSNKLTDLTD